ncbi:MAG: hypothetical protein V4687_13435 [Bacteroidota bacterium]
MKNIKSILILSAALLFSNGCKKDDLVVKNLNDPDFEKVYADGENIASQAGGLFTTVYNSAHQSSGVEPMLATAADNVTCSYGNFAMRDNSYEPRNFAWTNTAAYTYNTQTYNFFNAQYSAILTSSLIIKALNGGVNMPSTTPGTPGTKAFSRFIMGIAYANLALVFDRGFVVDEVLTLEGKIEDAVPYTDVAAAALKYLDDAISISTASTFTIPGSWLNTSGTISNVQLKALASTYAAKTMAYLPRNKTQLAAVNWAKVKTYADAGISADFNVTIDDINVYDNSSYYLGQGNDTWGRTDMYVVHLMDSAQPAHWDDLASFPTPPASTNPQDKRLLTDYKYLPSNSFIAARGYYHFSNYRSKRYDAIFSQDYWAGTKPEVMKAENDLLKAEARAYTSDPAGAAAIINAGTRVTRGQMTPVGTSLTAVVDAIKHERLVELPYSGANLAYYEMRKLDLLQKGTPLHYPLPAKILETIAAPAPFYTFGTVAKADGTGTSNAGWR